MKNKNSKTERDVFKDLKHLVNEYLSQSPIKAIGPSKMYLKSAFLISCWIISYILLLIVGPMSSIAGVVCLGVLLLLTCGLEFCIMHDASHKAYSSNRFVNKLALNMTLGVLGGCPLSWHQEHVVRHHSYTNILGSDPDVYASHVIRLHPHDKWYWWQKWQHYYAIPLYSLMWIHWVYNDLINATFNTYQLPKKKLLQFWGLIFLGLVPHVTLGLVLPYLVFNSMWVVGLSYMAFFMSVSFAMAITFVLAHVSDGQSFYLSHETKNKDWAVHQLETTMDFAVDNKFLTWLLGGLNFQVEHHIFPTICHLHYPKIQKIVKTYCKEQSIPYHEEKSVWSAFKSHLAHLEAMSVPVREESLKAAIANVYNTKEVGIA